MLSRLLSRKPAPAQAPAGPSNKRDNDAAGIFYLSDSSAEDLQAAIERLARKQQQARDAETGDAADGDVFVKDVASSYSKKSESPARTVVQVSVDHNTTKAVARAAPKPVASTSTVSPTKQATKGSTHAPLRQRSPLRQKRPVVQSPKDEDGDVAMMDSDEASSDQEEDDREEEEEEEEESPSETSSNDNGGPDENGEYVVEGILDHEYDDDGEILYKVKWLHWDRPEDITWEPESNFEHAHLILSNYKISHGLVGSAAARSQTANMGGASSRATPPTTSTGRSTRRLRPGTARPAVRPARIEKSRSPPPQPAARSHRLARRDDEAIEVKGTRLGGSSASANFTTMTRVRAPNQFRSKDGARPRTERLPRSPPPTREKRDKPKPVVDYSTRIADNTNRSRGAMADAIVSRALKK